MNYPLISFLIAIMLFASWAERPARADTTFDCSRFNLKYNPKTGEYKCVNVRGTSSNSIPGQSRTESVRNGRSIELRGEQTQRVKERQQLSQELNTKQREITRDQLDRQRRFMRTLETQQRGRF